MVPATDTTAEDSHRVGRRPSLEVLVSAEPSLRAEREEVPAGMVLDWSNPEELRAFVRLMTGELEELLCSLLAPPTEE